MTVTLVEPDGEEYVCTFCGRGQCRKCHDQDCTCCYGGDAG